MEISISKQDEHSGPAKMNTKILIADDHSMIRKGLKLDIKLKLGFNDI